MVHVGIIQMSCTSATAQNLEKAIAKIKEAAKMGAQIVCLQELFTSIYFCHEENYNYFELAESIPGATTKLLAKIASENKIVIVASLFEKCTAGLYFNTTVILNADGKYLGKYRKMHIPDDPGYYEKFYFTPGDLGYKVFETTYAKIGVLICWDQWYPEAARITSLMGAEILFYPTAIGWAKTQDISTNTEQYNAWQTLQRGHAIANGVHVVSVNRIGEEYDMKFWGGSFVSNPFGTLLYQAPHDTEAVKIITLHTEKTTYYRTHWPFLRDRRIDSYAPIAKRWIDTQEENE